MFPLKDTRGDGIFPFWVILIIVANVYIFALEILAADPDAFITSYAFIPANFSFMDPAALLPLLSAQFLHGGFIHIISNMWFLWVFGKNIERRFGLLFPIFYLFSGVAGNLTQYFISSDSSLPIIGASGAIAGVLGAYLALFPKHKIKTLIFVLFFAAVIEIPVSFMLFYWLITQLFSGAASVSMASAESVGGVAYFAHIGGFAGGWLIGKLMRP